VSPPGGYAEADGASTGLDYQTDVLLSTLLIAMVCFIIITFLWMLAANLRKLVR
jgi:hypothetical protein